MNPFALGKTFLHLSRFLCFNCCDGPAETASCLTLFYGVVSNDFG